MELLVVWSGSFSIQPAEFAKIICILILALLMSKIQKNGKDEISKISKLFLILTVFAVPVILIIKQPDYGTALAFVMALIFMLFTAGIKKRYIIISLILVIIAIPLLYFSYFQNMLKQELMYI